MAKVFFVWVSVFVPVRRVGVLDVHGRSVPERTGQAPVRLSSPPAARRARMLGSLITVRPRPACIGVAATAPRWRQPFCWDVAILLRKSSWSAAHANSPAAKCGRTRRIAGIRSRLQQIRGGMFDGLSLLARNRPTWHGHCRYGSRCCPCRRRSSTSSSRMSCATPRPIRPRARRFSPRWIWAAM